MAYKTNLKAVVDSWTWPILFLNYWIFYRLLINIRVLLQNQLKTKRLWVIFYFYKVLLASEGERILLADMNAAFSTQSNTLRSFTSTGS